MLPPDERGITDEDSDLSDDEATGTFIHLPRRILNAEAETSSLACTVPAPEAQQQPAKRKKRAPRKWSKKFYLPIIFQSQQAVMVHLSWVI